MAHEKPTIPEIQFYAIQTFGKKDSKRRSDLVISVAQKFSIPRVSADNHVSRLKSHGYIKNIAKGANNREGVVVQLTVSGRKVRDNPSRYRIKPYIKPASAKAPAAASSPAPVTLNVSDTADNVMDKISQLIQENAAYRDTILKTCREWAALLGMELREKESD